MQPTTLPDPRHEAFAKHLASGHDPVTAYVRAGFTPNNAKVRSLQLADDPDIRARTDHLKQCLPHIAELQDRFAPSLRLMPETQEEMLAWLWQVMNGTRQIRPLQLRAATLFCRMKGWHLNKPLPADQQPKPAAATLTDIEKAVLADFNRQTLSHDLTGMPCPVKVLATFQSQMADLSLAASLESPHGETASPSQPPENQPLETQNPQMGTNPNPTASPASSTPSVPRSPILPKRPHLRPSPLLRTRLTV